MSVKRECSICHVCGCGKALYDVNGQLYCVIHIPAVNTTVVDSQLLTPQQVLNINNGK